MNEELSCFKAYDVRGELGVNLDLNICYRIGYAFGKVLKLKKCIIGLDARESSPELADSVSKGLMDAGVNVLNLVHRMCIKIHLSVNQPAIQPASQSFR